MRAAVSHGNGVPKIITARVLKGVWRGTILVKIKEGEKAKPTGDLGKQTLYQNGMACLVKIKGMPGR